MGKRLSPQPFESVRKDDLFETRAVFERADSDLGDRGGDRDAGQGSAPCERRTANYQKPIGELDLLQVEAAFERAFADDSDGSADPNAGDVPRNFVVGSRVEVIAVYVFVHYCGNRKKEKEQSRAEETVQQKT